MLPAAAAALVRGGGPGGCETFLGCLGLERALEKWCEELLLVGVFVCQ